MFVSERPLLGKEITLAFSVFQTSIPYHQVRIKSDFGLNDRAWCEPTFGGWLLHMGPVGYIDCTRKVPIRPDGPNVDRVFIHELVHVWQGRLGINYVAGSLVQQCLLGAAAYSYTPGSNWSTYGVEQQGNIVMDWYGAGMATANSRYRYIRDNIRPGLIAP